jgi:RNA polymerase-binding transcription factor DksA
VPVTAVTRQPAVDAPTFKTTTLGAGSAARPALVLRFDAALMRFVDGRYGACVACGGSIAIERLRLLPATLFCLRCARRRPRGSRNDAALSAP